MDEPQTLPRKARGIDGRCWTSRRLARLFQALPPHAMEAEAAVLGAIFLDGSVAGDVLQVLRSGSEFFKPALGPSSTPWCRSTTAPAAWTSSS